VAKTRGRPRSFDREQALLRALDVFCVRGYDATTLQDLQEAMGGITPPSFYAAFGSKEQLFKEAVERYRATLGDRPMRALHSHATARASVQAMLEEAVAVFGAPDAPGCLVLLGGLNCTSPSVQEYLQAIRRQAPGVLVQRLERAVREGDLPPGLDLAAIAAFYLSVIYGLALRARDGAPPEALRASVDGAMAAWKTLTKPPAGRAASGVGRRRGRRSRSLAGVLA
jgi:AcrR family transcriptional regulator